MMFIDRSKSRNHKAVRPMSNVSAAWYPPGCQVLDAGGKIQTVRYQRGDQVWYDTRPYPDNVGMVRGIPITQDHLCALGFIDGANSFNNFRVRKGHIHGGWCVGNYGFWVPVHFVHEIQAFMVAVDKTIATI